MQQISLLLFEIVPRARASRFDPLLRISASFRVTSNPTLRINGYESHQPNREPQATDSRRPPETASRMGSAKRRIPNVRCLRGATHGSARTCARLLFTVTGLTAAHRNQIDAAFMLTRADFVSVC